LNLKGGFLCSFLGTDTNYFTNPLFQQQRITLGSASQLAGLHQIEFQQLIGDRGICIHYEIEDLEQDLSGLDRMVGNAHCHNPNFPFERPVQLSILDWSTREKQFSRPPEIAPPLYSHRCLALVPK
jgi:Uncharacterised protein family (UPF0175)